MTRSGSFGPLPPMGAYPPFTALRAFDAVARLGGVRKAAEALDIHHSAISRHLKTVEQWTGASLVVRDGRGVSLTDEGWRYHARLAAALDALAEATIAFSRERDRGKLVIWSRPGILAEWLVPRLDEFRATHPDLHLEVRPTQVTPEFLTHEVDLCVQYSSSYEPGFAPSDSVSVIEFMRSPVIPVASPKYLSAYPPVREPLDLLRHKLIEDEDDDSWGIWFDMIGCHECKIVPSARFWQPQHGLDAARNGQGVLLSTLFLAEEDFAKGTLVEVMGANGRFNAEMTGSYWLLGSNEDWSVGPRAMFRDWILAATGDVGENSAPRGTNDLRSLRPDSPTV